MLEARPQRIPARLDPELEAQLQPLVALLPSKADLDRICRANWSHSLVRAPQVRAFKAWFLWHFRHVPKAQVYEGKRCISITTPNRVHLLASFYCGYKLTVQTQLYLGNVNGQNFVGTGTRYEGRDALAYLATTPRCFEALEAEPEFPLAFTGERSLTWIDLQEHRLRPDLAKSSLPLTPRRPVPGLRVAQNPVCQGCMHYLSCTGLGTPAPLDVTTSVEVLRAHLEVWMEDFGRFKNPGSRYDMDLKNFSGAHNATWPPENHPLRAAWRRVVGLEP